MVVAKHFQEIIDISQKVTKLTLPTCKLNMFNIDYKDVDVDSCNATFDGTPPPLPFKNSDVFNADILSWRRLSAINNECKAIYEVTFNISGSNFQFKAGDTIGIVPRNCKRDVTAILSHLNLTSKADMYYKLTSEKSTKIPIHIPVTSTLRYVFTHCVDLRSVLKKLFLLNLARYTKEDEEKRAIEYLCSKQGSDAYSTIILNKNVCLIDLLDTFKSCQPPVEVLLANLPRLLPRPYSVVNTSLADADIMKICFSVIDTDNGRKGLTTGWLEKIILHDKMSNLEESMQKLAISDIKTNDSNIKIPIYLRKNMAGFSLPERPEVPLILIGPGTGVAPFIGFLEERSILIEKLPKSEYGEVWLFFGCRNPELDFIYREELNNFKSKGVLNKLTTVFSRVENNEGKYIQDALLSNGEEVVKLIKNGAVIYLCGDLKMIASEVIKVLVKCLMKYDHKTEEEAKSFITNMQNEKRYITDIWN